MKKTLLILLLIIPFLSFSQKKYIKYYDNNNIKVEGNLDSEGKQDGEWKFYYENGKVSDINIFKNGVANGLTVNYYKNGTIHLKGNLKNGKEDGEWKFYYASGVLEKKFNYTNGIRTGEQRSYFESGKIKTIKNIVMCDFDKLYPDPTPAFFGTKESCADGIWIEYYENGQIKKETIYKLAERIKKTCYTEEGFNVYCDSGLWME
tara:strand:+ start:626 stop:1240 length:615 start_codon:yes stop_codon:yes gene_type:complete